MTTPSPASPPTLSIDKRQYRRPPTETMADLLTRLDPILRNIAGAHHTEATPAEDMYQNLVLEILKTGNNPAFGDGYYIRLAHWRAISFCVHDQIYAKYVTRLPEHPLPSGKVAGFLEVYADPQASLPEDLLLAQEQIADWFAHLTPRPRQVLERLMQGERKSHIARALGIARSTVTSHIKQVREVIERLG